MDVMVVWFLWGTGYGCEDFVNVGVIHWICYCGVWVGVGFALELGVC